MRDSASGLEKQGKGVLGDVEASVAVLIFSYLLFSRQPPNLENLKKLEGDEYVYIRLRLES